MKFLAVTALGLLLGLGLLLVPVTQELSAQRNQPDPNYETRAQEVIGSLTQANGLTGWPSSQPVNWPESSPPRRLPGVSWDTGQKPAALQSLILTGLGLGKRGDISDLPFLRRLELGGNNFQSLNLSGNPSLEFVILNDNMLKSINIPDSPRLLHLGAASNDLSHLELSAFPRLQELLLSGNKIKEIHLDSAPDLENLEISNNGLLFLNTLHNPKIQRLRVSFNSLEYLDLSANTHLGLLNLRDNLLNNIKIFTNTELTELDLGQNRLREIDLTKNVQLIHLTLDHNHLTTLDLSSQAKLISLKAGDNPITSIILGDNLLSKLETIDLENCRLPLSSLTPFVSLAQNRSRLGHQGPVFFETLTITPEQGLDFSGETVIGDSHTEFQLLTEKGRRVSKNSWTLEKGIITINKTGQYHIQMTNPEIVSSEKNKTTSHIRTFKVKAKTGLIKVIPPKNQPRNT